MSGYTGIVCQTGRLIYGILFLQISMSALYSCVL